MLIEFSHTSTLAVLKWKQGERMALMTAQNIRGRTHVLFDMPPAGDFDHEKQRPLTPTEHVRLFGPRLRKCWGHYPAFVDAQAIDDQLHREGLSQHPLAELLERARLANALALPVTGLGRSGEYQRAVRRFAELNPSLPICVRVTSPNLDRGTLGNDLTALLGEIRSDALRVFLVLDFSGLAPLDEQAVEEFALLLADRIAELPMLHRWAGVAVALSSFPIAIKLKAGQSKVYPRTDLAVYERLITNKQGLLRTPMFGDYAVDTSPVEKPQRRTPSAHIRYSTPKCYILEKGTSVRKPYGYEAIRPVARAMVGRSEYAGASYSDGDRFFDLLARGEGTTGNAATWRWASTDHHLTLNIDAISTMFGVAEETSMAPADLPNAQLQLFPGFAEQAKEDNSK